MSLATSLPCTASLIDARTDIAAEVREWITTDEEERVRQNADVAEAKRYNASARAMNNALAEQQEMIEQHAVKLTKHAQALALQEQQLEQAETDLRGAIATKDESTKARLEQLRRDLRSEVKKKKEIQVLSQLQAAADRKRYNQMEDEKNLAAADEAERLRMLQLRKSRLLKESKQMDLIVKNNEKIQKNKELLNLQESQVQQAEEELKAAILAKDEASQTRIKQRTNDLKTQLLAKQAQLEQDRQENVERRNNNVLQLKESRRIELEENERQRIAAYRRAALLIEEEQRDYILKNQQKQVAWEAALRTIEEEKQREETALIQAIEKKDEETAIRLRKMIKENEKLKFDKQQQISEISSAIREKRERVEHDERERRQQLAESIQQQQYVAKRRVKEAKTQEAREYIEKNQRKEDQIAKNLIRIEQNKQKLEQKMAAAVSNKDTTVIARLKQLKETNDTEMQQLKMEKDQNVRETNLRRTLLLEEEKQRVLEDAKETQRLRQVSQRRAIAMKEEAQMANIIENRKKNVLAQKRIDSVEQVKSKEEERYRVQRRRRSILGNERVKTQKQQLLQQTEDKKKAKAAKTLEAQRRREQLQQLELERRAATAKAIEEKDKHAKQRIKNINMASVSNSGSATATPVDLIENTSVVKIQSMQRGRSGRIRAKKKQVETKAAVTIQKHTRGKIERKKTLVAHGTPLGKPDKRKGKTWNGDTVNVEDSAALRIQSIQRGRTGRRASIQRKEDKRKQAYNAVKIQAVHRGGMERKAAEKRRKSIVKIQANARGYKFRKNTGGRKPSRPRNGSAPTKKSGTSRAGRVIEASLSVK